MKRQRLSGMIQEFDVELVDIAASVVLAPEVCVSVGSPPGVVPAAVLDVPDVLEPPSKFSVYSEHTALLHVYPSLGSPVNDSDPVVS